MPHVTAARSAERGTRSKPELYIFDLDGTLLDSATDICAAMVRAIETVAPGAPPVSHEQIRPWIGRPLTDMFDALAPGCAMDTAVARYREVYAEICTDNTLPFPGVVETLEALAGARRAVATTKRTWMAKLIVDRLGMARHFDLVQGTDDFPYKPDPAILHHILRHFGVAPERALMVGDTASDVLCARAAGVPCAAALYGNAAREELLALDPEYVLEDLTALRRLEFTPNGSVPAPIADRP